MTPNPFPGLNPYVEPYWNDFGQSILSGIREVLNGNRPNALPDDLRISTCRRDVLAFDGDRTPMPRWWLEVVRRVRYGETYTAIEVLHPAEKRPGDGRDQFRHWQQWYRGHGHSRVVIDLLRAGQSPLEDVDDELPPRVRDRPFRVHVFRGGPRANVAVNPISLREPLPPIPIPLRPGEADAVVHLQPLADRAYEVGRFPINYDRPCDPPLTGDDAAWAAELLAR